MESPKMITTIGFSPPAFPLATPVLPARVQGPGARQEFVPGEPCAAPPSDRRSTGAPNELSFPLLGLFPSAEHAAQAWETLRWAIPRATHTVYCFGFAGCAYLLILGAPSTHGPTVHHVIGQACGRVIGVPAALENLVRLLQRRRAQYPTSHLWR